MLESFLLAGGIRMKGSFSLADVRFQEVLSKENRSAQEPVCTGRSKGNLDGRE
jgi:hypothetical protein